MTITLDNNLSNNNGYKQLLAERIENMKKTHREFMDLNETAVHIRRSGDIFAYEQRIANRNNVNSTLTKDQQSLILSDTLDKTTS